MYSPHCALHKLNGLEIFHEFIYLFRLCLSWLMFHFNRAFIFLAVGWLNVSIFCIRTLSLYTSLFRFILPIMTFRNTCYWSCVTCVCAGYYRVQKESSTAGKAVPSPDCITILVSTIVQLFWCKLHPYSMRTSSVFVYDYGLYSSQVTYWWLFLFFKKKEQKRNEKHLCLDIFFSISRHLEKCVLRGCSRSPFGMFNA